MIHISTGNPFLDKLENGLFNSLGLTVFAAQSSTDLTPANAIASYLASIPEALIGNLTFTDLSFLTDKTAIAVPNAALSAAHSPTVDQLFQAANAAYVVAGIPSNLQAFLVDGRQLAYTDLASGSSARVWLTASKQIIIAYSGTAGGDTQYTNPLQVPQQVLSDVDALIGEHSQAEFDALSFARHVTQLASKQGISSADIYVTGHSLGAIQASYVAQQTGLGGAAFESTGIPKSSTAAGNGSNFLSFVTYGDPVASLGSDVQGYQPVAPAYAAGQGGALPHYGTLIMIGDVADQVSLAKEVGQWNTGVITTAKIVSDLLNVGFREFHYPGNQAADLGITPGVFSITQDSNPTQHGVIFKTGGNTIAQTIAADAVRESYHAAVLPGS